VSVGWLCDGRVIDGVQNVNEKKSRQTLHVIRNLCNTQSLQLSNVYLQLHTDTMHSIPISLSLQSSAVEQVLDILMDVLSWEIAKVVSPCLPRGL